MNQLIPRQLPDFLTFAFLSSADAPVLWRRIDSSSQGVLPALAAVRGDFENVSLELEGRTYREDIFEALELTLCAAKYPDLVDEIDLWREWRTNNNGATLSALPAGS